jgi:hypothetical protein
LYWSDCLAVNSFDYGIEPVIENGGRLADVLGGTNMAEISFYPHLQSHQNGRRLIGNIVCKKAEKS